MNTEGFYNSRPIKDKIIYCPVCKAGFLNNNKGKAVCSTECRLTYQRCKASYKRRMGY